MEMVVVFSGRTKALSVFDTRLSDHWNVSVGSRAMESSCTVKVMALSASLGAKVICWSILKPVSACNAEMEKD